MHKILKVGFQVFSLKKNWPDLSKVLARTGIFQNFLVTYLDFQISQNFLIILMGANAEHTKNIYLSPKFIGAVLQLVSPLCQSLYIYVWSVKRHYFCYRNAVTEKEIKVDGPKNEASQIIPNTI